MKKEIAEVLAKRFNVSVDYFEEMSLEVEKENLIRAISNSLLLSSNTEELLEKNPFIKNPEQLRNNIFDVLSEYYEDTPVEEIVEDIEDYYE